jgi:ribosomal protein S18 acetylase RimI-like enzyme
MEITYRETVPARDEFFALFETTGWNRAYQLTPDELMQAIRKSWYFISVYDVDRLVGFGRVLSDTIVHALILDLIVLPSHQRRGIGGRILELLVARCRCVGMRDIQLFCAKGSAGFYESYGFKRRPEDAPGMEIKRFPEVEAPGSGL